MNDAVTIISNVGFPIFSCMVMSYITYNVLTKTTEAIHALNQTIVLMSNEITDLKTAITSRREIEK